MKLAEILLEKKLRVFDFDDTLVKSKSRVIVINNGKKKFLTPAQFAVYTPKKDDEFDYSEFGRLVEPKTIKATVKFFQRMVASASTGGSRVEILTARNTPKPVDDWFQAMGISQRPVKALGDANPEAKARYIERRIQDGFTDIAFFDDSIKNIRAVDRLKKKYPKIKIKTQHIKY
jgi:hypothetical protein